MIGEWGTSRQTSCKIFSALQNPEFTNCSKNIIILGSSSFWEFHLWYSEIRPHQSLVLRQSSRIKGLWIAVIGYMRHFTADTTLDWTWVETLNRWTSCFIEGRGHYHGSCIAMIALEEETPCMQTYVYIILWCNYF